MVNQYDIFLINLDPTVGHEIKKKRPCIIISPNEMNKYLATVIIAPMTTKSRSYPMRVKIKFNTKEGWIVLDQIRSVDKMRLIAKIGVLEKSTIDSVKSTLKEMLVD